MSQRLLNSKGSILIINKKEVPNKFQQLELLVPTGETVGFYSRNHRFQVHGTDSSMRMKPKVPSRETDLKPNNAQAKPEAS